jgi:uncharacterized protein YkwD
MACAAPPASSPAKPADVAKARSGAEPTARDADEVFAWPAETFSPRSATESSPDSDRLSELCDARDAALDRVAARLARRQLRARPNLDVAEISFALRAEGCPYVWPRAWTLEGSSKNGGRRVVAAVAADVLGELAPLPTRVRVGQWLDVRGELIVAADAAKVVVLGPRGRPKSVPTSLSNRLIVARFAADREGPWLVQILATPQGGPRQILEALTFAGVEPDTAYTSSPAPGEDRARGTTDARAALERMINGARASEGLGPLRRAKELDEIAQQHAGAMRDAGRIAHDLGRGDPQARVEESGLSVRVAGENVAHASDAASAHRALWRSPSHRENLLEPRFDAVGIGVATGGDGSLWVCEVFADL